LECARTVEGRVRTMNTTGVWLACCAVVALWIVTAFLVPLFFGCPTSAAEFGDMFGGLNTLFSGLAFVVLIFALRLQSQELALQRSELQLTRQELAGQKEQLALQNTTLKRQAFENTFFQLLRGHQVMVGSLDIRGPGSDARSTVLGRDCFGRYYKYLKGAYQNPSGHLVGAVPSLLIEDAYSRFNLEYQADLGHYFRNLYNLVKFVDRSELPSPEKKFYTNLVRAQLSSDELLVLFYNCISHFGKDKFKPLVERYALLKGLPQKLLLNEEHGAFYDIAAYGGN
jgi:hypothetical protein